VGVDITVIKKVEMLNRQVLVSVDVHIQHLYLGDCGWNRRASSCGQVWCSCCGGRCWASRWRMPAGTRYLHDGTDALRRGYIQRSSQRTPTTTRNDKQASRPRSTLNESQQTFINI